MMIRLGKVRVACPICGDGLDVTVVGTMADDGRTIEVTTDPETAQLVRDHVEKAH